MNDAASDESLQIRLEPFTSAGELEAQWRHLQAKASPSFFLSWTWIGSWLETMRVRPLVLAAYCRGQRIGLALLSNGRRSQLGLPRRALFLHEVGDPSKDVAMIEDNGFLAARGFERPVARAALRFLRKEGHTALVASGVEDWLAEEARAEGWCDRVVALRPCPYRVLDSCDENDLARLSRNARSQIARSIRLYEERYGPVELTPSPSLAEARERLAAMAIWHQRRWVAAGQPGAFAFPTFVAFHERVLSCGFAAGEADVLRIAAGSTEIGYLYNFYYGNEAYAYQNGFASTDDQRLKPGLVSHLLAFAHYRRKGALRYRFLAGDSRYKRTLSTGSYDLYWLVFERDDWLRRTEGMVRRLRALVKSRPAEALGDANAQ